MRIKFQKTLKTIILPFVFCSFIGFTAFAMSDYFPRSWKYKMTVVVETPEGDYSGSAVRQITNSVPPIDLPDAGNPADLKGEAVVVDLGERGVLFAILTDDTRRQFYRAFPLPGKTNSAGATTAEGIRYHNNLPIGAKGKINMDEHRTKFVTFIDMDNPKSVTPVLTWILNRAKNHPRGGYYEIKENRIEEIFGEGVRIKDITIEITNDPIEWGIVDQHLPKGFQDMLDNWAELSNKEKHRIGSLNGFKQGEPK